MVLVGWGQGDIGKTLKFKIFLWESGFQSGKLRKSFVYRCEDLSLNPWHHIKEKENQGVGNCTCNPGTGEAKTGFPRLAGCIELQVQCEIFKKVRQRVTEEDQCLVSMCTHVHKQVHKWGAPC